MYPPKASPTLGGLRCPARGAIQMKAGLHVDHGGLPVSLARASRPRVPPARSFQDQVLDGNECSIAAGIVLILIDHGIDGSYDSLSLIVCSASVSTLLKSEAHVPPGSEAKVRELQFRFLNPFRRKGFLG